MTMPSTHNNTSLLCLTSWHSRILSSKIILQTIIHLNLFFVTIAFGWQQHYYPTNIFNRISQPTIDSTITTTTRSKFNPYQKQTQHHLFQKLHHTFLTSKSFSSSSDDQYYNDDDDDDDDDDDIIEYYPQSSSSNQNNNDDDDDWRQFRAKLVLQQRQNTTTTTSTDSHTLSSSPPSSSSNNNPQLLCWAFDAGHNIEKGSLILSRPTHDFCRGLDQQYFHKCLILVLEHNVDFTKGIILNRMSDLLLTDGDFEDEDDDDDITTGDCFAGDGDDENEWNVWFGGDVKGLFSEEDGEFDNEVVCLHGLTSEMARSVSEVVVGDLQMTDFRSARHLVLSSHATPDDFFLFCGYAGWSPGQLRDELIRDTWYMVSADDRTVMNELNLLKNDASYGDVGGAGLRSWNKIMGLIDERVEEEEGGVGEEERFADDMLKQWVRDKLIFDNNKDDDDDDDDVIPTTITHEFTRRILSIATSTAGDDLKPGSLLRTSPSTLRQTPPFLLSHQEFHKSIILLIKDEEAMSVGVLLNHVTSECERLTLGNDTVVDVPLRFGGRFGVWGDEETPVFWFHRHEGLKRRRVGLPLSSSAFDDDGGGGIWKCSRKEVIKALNENSATVDDFMAVSGFCAWEKYDEGYGGGARGLIWEGDFQLVVSSSNNNVVVGNIWNVLLTQRMLSRETIDENIRLMRQAWAMGGVDDDSIDYRHAAAAAAAAAADVTLDDSLIITSPDNDVFGSSTKAESCRSLDTDVDVSLLADDALRYWIQIFLLDET